MAQFGCTCSIHVNRLMQNIYHFGLELIFSFHDQACGFEGYYGATNEAIWLWADNKEKGSFAATTTCCLNATCYVPFNVCSTSACSLGSCCSASPAASAPAPALPAPPKPAQSSHLPLKCPMAGTFYRSPAPGEPPFVKVRSCVSKSTILNLSLLEKSTSVLYVQWWIQK